MPCDFQDLSQLVQVWQAALKITRLGASPGQPPALSLWAGCQRARGPMGAMSRLRYKRNGAAQAETRHSDKESSPLGMRFSSMDSFAGTTLPWIWGIWKGLGMELWPREVRMLTQSRRGQHRGVFLRAAWAPPIFPLFSSPKRPTGPCDYLLVNQTDTYFSQ